MPKPNFCSPPDTLTLNFFQQIGHCLLPPSERPGLSLNTSLNFPTSHIAQIGCIVEFLGYSCFPHLIKGWIASDESQPNLTCPFHHQSNGLWTCRRQTPSWQLLLRWAFPLQVGRTGKWHCSMWVGRAHSCHTAHWCNSQGTSVCGFSWSAHAHIVSEYSN